MVCIIDIEVLENKEKSDKKNVCLRLFISIEWSVYLHRVIIKNKKTINQEIQ